VHLANRRVDLGTGRRLAPLRRPLRRAHKGQGRSESFGLPLDQCSTSRETRLLDRTSWSIATGPSVGRAPHDLPDLPLQQPVRSGTAPRSKPCPDCGGPWFRPAMIGCWPQPSDNQHSGSIPSAAVCLILRLVFLRRGAQRDERDITSLVSSTQPRSVTEPHGAFWLLLIWWCRSPGNSMPVWERSTAELNGISRSKAGRAPALDGAMRAFCHRRVVAGAERPPIQHPGGGRIPERATTGRSRSCAICSLVIRRRGLGRK
jgi:hypothetical protein